MNLKIGLKPYAIFLTKQDKGNETKPERKSYVQNIKKCKKVKITKSGHRPIGFTVVIWSLYENDCSCFRIKKPQLYNIFHCFHNCQTLALFSLSFHSIL